MSPSSGPAIMQCACYEGGYEDLNPFSDANIGNALHECCENMMNGIEPPNYEILTDEYKEKCETGVKEVRAFCQARYPETKILTEQHVIIRDVYGNIISEGTQDIWCPPDIGGDWKSGLDYKSGKIDYKPQQAFYALGRMQQECIDKMQWFEYYLMPERLIPYEITKEECIAIVRSVYQRKYMVKKKPQICYFCRNCRNILYCPAVNKALKMIGDCYKDLPLPENINNPEEIIDGKVMSKVLIFAKDVLAQYTKRIVAVAAKVETAALKLADEGVPLPYWQLKGKASSFIEDIDEAYRLAPVQKEAFQKALKLSIPQLANAYWAQEKAKGNKISQKVARNQLEARLMSIIKIGEMKYSLERKMEE